MIRSGLTWTILVAILGVSFMWADFEVRAQGDGDQDWIFRCVPAVGSTPSGATCTRGCSVNACNTASGCVVYSSGKCVETEHEHTCVVDTEADLINFVSTCTSTECPVPPNAPKQYKCDWTVSGGQCGFQTSWENCSGT